MGQGGGPPSILDRAPRFENPTADPSGQEPNPNMILNPLVNLPGRTPEEKAITTDHRLADTFARKITYLRISLTDQCNLRCLYCRPQPEIKLGNRELLSSEELLRVARLAVGLGIKKIRLTGGEPLIRRGIIDFVREVGAIPGLEDLRLTTNGVLLAELGPKLRQAGIAKLNISLDTLRPDRFKEITGADLFPQVWAGIEQARELGFKPLKINTVALRGINDDEFSELAQLTFDYPYHLRFIEFMPIGKNSRWGADRYISSQEIMTGLAPLGELVPVASTKMDGPARVYRFAGAHGSVGFISPLSHQFCDRCNRLRLTSEGRLRACLLRDQESDLKVILRTGGSDEEIRAAILQAIFHKPQGHGLSMVGPGNCHGHMSRIGG